MNLRDQAPRQQSKAPFQSREEFLVDESLQIAYAPAEAIRQIRPVAPVILHAERRGFTTSQAGFHDVLSADRLAPSNRSWVSGVIVQPSIISDYSDTKWGGSARNAMSEGVY